MKLSDLNINFLKFNNEKDTLIFELNKSFFGLKENSLYDSCQLKTVIECEKSDSTIKLDYQLTGYVDTLCERCLKEIEIPIDAKFTEGLKLTGNADLIQTENYISAQSQVYCVYDSIYDQICLNMPTRKICANSKTKDNCELNYSADVENRPTDARWDKLKTLIK